MQLTFRGPLWLRALYLLTIVMGVVMIVGMYREGDRGFALYIPLVFILVGYFAWPRAVHLDDGEIRKRDAFLRLTRIPRAEVASVVLDTSSGKLVVFGKSGQRIVYGNFDDGGERLMEQLEIASGKETTVMGGL
jgi:hypothetical protein